MCRPVNRSLNFLEEKNFKKKRGLGKTRRDGTSDSLQREEGTSRGGTTIDREERILQRREWCVN